MTLYRRTERPTEDPGQVYIDFGIAEPVAEVMWCFTHALAAVSHNPWRCPEYRPYDDCDVGKAAVYRIEEDS